MSATAATAESTRDLVFPPMPASLLRLQEEMRKESPDLRRLGEVVSADGSLAAEVLRTVNSPVFRRRSPLSSISQAVMMLGAGKVHDVAVAASLRASVTMKGAWIERFWEVAGDVGLVMAFLARELGGVSPEKGYTLGLFHDSGIPLLRARYEDYEAALKGAALEPARIVTDMERERYGMHHAMVGARLSQTWNLDPVITLAIRRHHDWEQLCAPDNGVEEEVGELVGLLKMAEQISNAFRGLAFRNVIDDHEWARIGSQVLAKFGLSDDDFHHLSDQAIDLLSAR